MSLGTPSTWARQDDVVPLRAGEVQVWRVQAAGDGPLADGCRALLSRDEWERMGRMRMGVARDEFLVGRGCLRVLVGAALGIEPKDVAFEIGEHGKPQVQGVEFNVAHSRGVVLIALCRDAAVGVDVEWVDPEIEAMDIAQGSFAAAEIAAIAAVSGLARARAFYGCWTRKEAVTKAHGDGLTMALKEFAVPVAGADEAQVVTSEARNPGFMNQAMGGQEERAGYYVREVVVGEGFAGALAVGAKGQKLRQFTMDRLPGGQRSIPLKLHVGGELRWYGAPLWI